MLEFFRNLFTSDFMPHGHCYYWRNDILFLHAMSDGLIALAYFSIPLSLIYFVRKRKDLAFNWIFVLFGVFILACGTTHILEIWSIWHGTYRLTGFVKLLTGGVSIATAALLYPLVPRALRLPSPAQLQKANEDLEVQIEERTRAEESLRNERGVLERRVDERTRELAHANAWLKTEIAERERADHERRLLETKGRQAQKLDSLGVLAGGIAHDFNNLLTGILGNAELALMDLEPESPLRPLVDEIQSAAVRAADLTRQMLAFSGKGRFEAESLELTRLLKEMTPRLKSAVSNNATLRFELAENLPPVDADPSQLRQVVMNLITNASEAVASAGGVIDVKAGVMRVDRAYLAGTFFDEGLAEGEYVFIEVADSGPGMDEATMAKIFDPFFTTKFTGRGLGLAAVLGIVRGHHGAIKVTSQPGDGTRVRILFPALRREVPASAETDLKSPGDGWRGEGKVLVIDDEETVRKVTKGMLSKLGFTPVVAEDGPSGIEALRADPGGIVCVVLDMTMPVMSGAETFGELRGIRADLPIILCSGYTEEDAVQRFEGKGLSGFVQKPVRVEVLANKLRHALVEKQRRDAGPSGEVENGG